MAVLQKTKSCPVCGAITAILISDDPDAPWDLDDSERHAEWHARISAALTTLAARQDGISPRHQAN